MPEPRSLTPPDVVVVAAIVESGGRLLVTRRPPGVHLAGLWEFPGGKVAADEPHDAALRREIREELDADVEVGGLEYEVAHRYPDRTVRLFFYRCTLLGAPTPLLGQEMRWVLRTELASLEFPPADRALIERLLRNAAPSGGLDSAG